ncbi:hypothetical protein HS088_TW13G00232 [Tripterygium wilfordii]|uniref:C2H2-type domain-containing protein n=1 Tax=Tripterygium wilfordii TaxID=458696 RepID=A0A7J7CTD5_TRIWF|nr:hypothetical protein HS088_TW13G00232 [Tripterygium wilfordii]
MSISSTNILQPIICLLYQLIFSSSMAEEKQKPSSNGDFVFVNSDGTQVLTNDPYQCPKCKDFFATSESHKDHIWSHFDEWASKENKMNNVSDSSSSVQLKLEPVPEEEDKQGDSGSAVGEGEGEEEDWTFVF